MQNVDFQIVPVGEPGADLDAVHDLLVEYGKSLDFSLCFQGFEQELAALPGDYVLPRGCLFLARVGNEAAGCVGVRRLDAARCEMKRLYVRPAFRGMGLGRRLAKTAMAAACRVGYRTMVLDSLSGMKAARDLYLSLGFAPCAPYYDNRCIGSDCFEIRRYPSSAD